MDRCTIGSRVSVMAASVDQFAAFVQGRFRLIFEIGAPARGQPDQRALRFLALVVGESFESRLTEKRGVAVAEQIDLLDQFARDSRRPRRRPASNRRSASRVGRPVRDDRTSRPRVSQRERQTGAPAMVLNQADRRLLNVRVVIVGQLLAAYRDRRRSGTRPASGPGDGAPPVRDGA